jgi:hypothetical protein
MFDLLVDIIFVIDMGLMFVSSYQDKNGKEMKKSSMIASKYIKSVRFCADFFAILGTGFVTDIVP